MELRDKLISVFSSLRRRKKDPIMTRVKAADCHVCSLSLLRGLCKDIKAFAYWTSNDDRNYRREGVMRIRYGVFDGTTTQAKEVGKSINDALVAAGFTTRWSGRPTDVIAITDYREESGD